MLADYDKNKQGSPLQYALAFSYSISRDLLDREDVRKYRESVDDGETDFKNCDFAKDCFKNRLDIPLKSK